MRRQLVQSVMVITFFGWLTTISVLSILRYMLPVFPFLFLLFPAILPLRWQKPIYTDATIQAVVQSSNTAGN